MVSHIVSPCSTPLYNSSYLAGGRGRDQDQDHEALGEGITFVSSEYQFPPIAAIFRVRETIIVASNPFCQTL